MSASLFVVATPIGNLEDITLRALSTLKAVTLIAAEDTRRTGNLLRHFGISTPTTSFHQHNEQQKLPQLLKRLEEGDDIALVSDAGTPVVADPGQRLIAAAIEKHIRVVPIPGPSSVLTVLSASGLPADSFRFAGFAPHRSKDRIKWFEELAAEKIPVVFFETPHRIDSTMREMAAILGDRPIIIGRELTKAHEQLVYTTAERSTTEPIPARGEFTVVIAPAASRSTKHVSCSDSDIYNLFCQLTNNKDLPRRAALAETAAKLGLTTKTAYAAVERAKKSVPS